MRDADMIALHEAGHALIGHWEGDLDSVSVSRDGGQARVALRLPPDDLASFKALLDRRTPQYASDLQSLLADYPALEAYMRVHLAGIAAVQARGGHDILGEIQSIVGADQDISSVAELFGLRCTGVGDWVGWRSSSGLYRAVYDLMDSEIKALSQRFESSYDLGRDLDDLAARLRSRKQASRADVENLGARRASQETMENVKIALVVIVALGLFGLFIYIVVEQLLH